jgi:hypothetical protein
MIEGRASGEAMKTLDRATVQAVDAAMTKSQASTAVLRTPDMETQIFMVRNPYLRDAAQAAVSALMKVFEGCEVVVNLQIDPDTSEETLSIEAFTTMPGSDARRLLWEFIESMMPEEVRAFEDKITFSVAHRKCA